MNTCVKTGFTFYDPVKNVTMTGDLKCTPDGSTMFIDGINPTPRCDGLSASAHAEIEPADYIVKESGYLMTEPGIELTSVSPSFRSHINEWAREVAHFLPTEVTA